MPRLLGTLSLEKGYSAPYRLSSYRNLGWDLTLLLFCCSLPREISFPELLERGVGTFMSCSNTWQLDFWNFLVLFPFGEPFFPKSLLFLPCSFWFHSEQLLRVGSPWRRTWLVSPRAQSGEKALSALDLPAGCVYSSPLEWIKGPLLSAVPLSPTLQAVQCSPFGAFPVLKSTKIPTVSWGYLVTFCHCSCIWSFATEWLCSYLGVLRQEKLCHLPRLSQNVSCLQGQHPLGNP